MNKENIIIEVKNPHTIKLILTGDVHLGTNYHQKMAANPKKKYNLYGVKDFTYLGVPFAPLLHTADFVIANLETPILNNAPPPYYGDLKQYYHRDFAHLLFPLLQQLNVKAVTLANNHILDYGPASLLRTLEDLHANGFPYIGAGRDTAEAKKVLFIDFTKDHRTLLKVALVSAFEYRKKYDEVYEFYADTNKPGVNKLTRRTLANQIRTLKQSDPERFVIFYPHWGIDYQWITSQQKRSAAAIIEAGADLIIGHGSHFSQDIEYINSIPIVYGLGNFIFLTPGRFQKSSEIPSMGLVAQLHFNFDAEKAKFNKTLNLYPIQANNRITRYQPRFADKRESSEVFEILLEKSVDKKGFLENIKTDTDKFGEYFSLRLQ